MQLLLLRHAKSSWKDGELDDHDRPLNRRGRAAAAEMGTYMLREGLLPDLALISSARRTQETWERLIGRWNGESSPCKILKSLYLAAPSQLLAQVRRTPAEVNRLLLIGHNPGLERLAKLLAGPQSAKGPQHSLEAKYPTGALACFRVAGKSWSDLAPGGAILTDFVLPRGLEHPDEG